jgi:hypothetical protein
VLCRSTLPPSASRDLLPSVAQGRPGERQVVTRLVDQATRDPKIEELGHPVHPGAPANLEHGLGEWRCAFVRGNDIFTPGLRGSDPAVDQVYFGVGFPFGSEHNVQTPSPRP